MVHKHSIEGVRFRSAATGNPSHEVPYIRLYLPVRPSLHNKHNISAYLQMTSLSKQLCTPGWSIDRAAISVGVQQLWGSCLAFSYLSKAMNKEFRNKVLQANLLMSPVAMGQRSSRPSDSVSTETRTSPLSLPTLVHQEALPAAVPCNFLHTFFVESIFSTLPKTEVQVARS